jgi:hypothetical protein
MAAASPDPRIPDLLRRTMRRLFYLAVIAAIVVFGAEVARFTRQHWPTSAATSVHAVITNQAGAPPPAGVPPGQLLVLSAAQSTVAPNPEAVLWQVEPRTVDRAAMRTDLGRTLIVPAGAVAGAIFHVRLYVCRANMIDMAQLSFTVDADEAHRPRPRPDPDPVPGPTPPPQPTPAGAVDPAVRRAAAAYFGAYPTGYRAVAEVAGSTGKTYNQLFDGALEKRKQLGGALGAEIDRLTVPIVDPATNHFVGQPESGRVLRLIADSLAAGLRDAGAP